MTWAEARRAGFSMTSVGFETWVILLDQAPIGYVQTGWRLGPWGGACPAGHVFRYARHTDAAAALAAHYTAAGKPPVGAYERGRMLDRIEAERELRARRRARRAA